MIDRKDYITMDYETEIRAKLMKYICEKHTMVEARRDKGWALVDLDDPECLEKDELLLRFSYNWELVTDFMDDEKEGMSFWKYLYRKSPYRIDDEIRLWVAELILQDIGD